MNDSLGGRMAGMDDEKGKGIGITRAERGRALFVLLSIIPSIL